VAGRSNQTVHNGSGLAIKRSPHGRGVFATRRFRKGQIIERCPTVEVADADVVGRLDDYVYASVKQGDSLIVLGYGMLYNHSAEPNVDYDQVDPSEITYRALRTIEPGEELTIDYGDDWWETRGRTPG
jgi:uncharacterized protein